MLPAAIVIHPPPFDPIAAYGIGGITILVAIVWVVLFSQRNSGRALVLSIAVTVLMALSAIIALSGQLSRFDSFPPPMLIMIASVFIVSFALGLSSFGRNAAAHSSFATLVGFQSFRLPLELIMHQAGNVGIMPVQLSYSGYNFDIVTGITALLLFVAMQLGATIPRSVLWAWNLWGWLCLVVIVFIAIATSPVVRASGDEPQHLNTWVLYFPYVWLPVVLVTAAISGHIIVTRKLLMEAGGRYM
jgi:hypothetical protein